jgi:hypothetical protein
MLIAHLKAHLVTGETVELLPVRHETDVKKEWTARGLAFFGISYLGEIRLSVAPGAEHRSGGGESFECRSGAKNA